jgi:hypothetical protein
MGQLTDRTRQQPAGTNLLQHRGARCSDRKVEMVSMTHHDIYDWDANAPPTLMT